MQPTDSWIRFIHTEWPKCKTLASLRQLRYINIANIPCRRVRNTHYKGFFSSELLLSTSTLQLCRCNSSEGVRGCWNHSDVLWPLTGSSAGLRWHLDYAALSTRATLVLCSSLMHSWYKRGLLKAGLNWGHANEGDLSCEHNQFDLVKVLLRFAVKSGWQSRHQRHPNHLRRPAFAGRDARPWAVFMNVHL